MVLSAFLAAVLCIVLATKYVMLRARVAFADSQVRIFEELSVKAAEASDPFKLSGLLEYTVKYYPSGSKQVAGSHLDRVVETVRSNTVATIVAHLRSVTGKDYGNHPARWFEQYPPLRP